MTYKFLRLFFVLFLALCSIGEAKPPPQLTPHDTKLKLEEIFKAHANYQTISPEIARRAIENYLEELDPSKTYFTTFDIAPWTHPSDELLNFILQEYNQEKFSVFQSIYNKMIKCIERREQLEPLINLNELPKNVDSKEFKDISWAQSEEELLERLKRIRSLQIEVAEKLNQETKQQFFYRLNKRRLLREEELCATSPLEREQNSLAYLLKAVSAALDSQTTYFTPAEAAQFMMQVQQRLFGIGAQLHDELNGFTITRIFDGSPASLGNKLKINDRIIAVNKEPIVGMDIVEAVELIRGPAGSSVTLTILRQEEKLDIEIIRDEVVLKETRFEYDYAPFGNGIIAHIHLFSFYQDPSSSSAQDIEEVIKKLKKEHQLKGIILDLRNNSGGLLPQAVMVTGLFIKKGVVVSIKDNSQAIQHLRNVENRMAWDGPLVVLTNKASASASEIVAQTLQDYGRAFVIGDATTYGKGTFQTFTLENTNYGKVNPKGEFKVTRGRYYTVSGKSPQLGGVLADVVVPGVLSQLEIGEKFSKFPLASDQIPAVFEDDLLDVPVIHRARIARAYKINLQPKVTTYAPYLETLKKNSAQRIENNKNYQTLIKEISSEKPGEDKDSFGQTDLQLEETLNLMKDLIILLETG